MKNHFATLGVHRQSTVEQITVARRALALKQHPDHGGTQEGMAALNEAHHVLTNREERARYLALIDAAHFQCADCNGQGATRKQRGFTGVEVHACKRCSGAGVVLP